MFSLPSCSVSSGSAFSPSPCNLVLLFVSVENRIFRSKRKKHTCSEMQGRNTNKIPSVKCSTPDYSSDSYLYIYILASYLHISFFCSISFLFCRSYPGQSKELCE